MFTVTRSIDTLPSLNRPALRAILFDLDDTLIDRTGAYHRYAADFVARRCEELSSIEHQAMVEAMCAHDANGYRNRDEHCQWIAEHFEPWGVSPDYAWEDYLENIGRFVQPDFDSIALIASLREKCRVAVVTNGSRRTQELKIACANLDDAFDAVFISGEVGVEKPRPEIFHHALHWTGCSADQVLFVGDDPINDIEGASGVGMKTCWVNHGRSFPPEFAQPDWNISSIREFDTVLL
jgi:putative hydrolase of the HAD superfamily